MTAIAYEIIVLLLFSSTKLFHSKWLELAEGGNVLRGLSNYPHEIAAACYDLRREARATTR